MAGASLCVVREEWRDAENACRIGSAIEAGLRTARIHCWNLLEPGGKRASARVVGAGLRSARRLPGFRQGIPAVGQPGLGAAFSRPDASHRALTISSG